MRQLVDAGAQSSFALSGPLDVGRDAEPATVGVLAYRHQLGVGEGGAHVGVEGDLDDRGILHGDPLHGRNGLLRAANLDPAPGGTPPGLARVATHRGDHGTGSHDGRALEVRRLRDVHERKYLLGRPRQVATERDAAIEQGPGIG
jgi:hypothetical protein